MCWKNVCSVPLEWTCSEVGTRSGELSILRAKFSIPRSNGLFSRSDSCQNRAKRDFGSPDGEKRTIWSRKWKFWLEERKKAQEFYYQRSKSIPEAQIYFLCCWHAMTPPHDLELFNGPSSQGNRGCFRPAKNSWIGHQPKHAQQNWWIGHQQNLFNLSYWQIVTWIMDAPNFHEFPWK